MSIRKTNCVIQWIEIYLVDIVIHLLNNWGQILYMLVIFPSYCLGRKFVGKNQTTKNVWANL